MAKRTTKRLLIRPNEGFTLIELLLAMSFISVLLLAIALSITQISTIYTKGLALKEVNQTSREIATDIRRTIQGASMLDLANDYVTTPAGGRLCFGSFSYVWNTTSALAASDPNISTYEGSGKQVHFAKVPDLGKIYCSKGGGGAVLYKNIRAVDVPTTQELLDAGEHKLTMNALALSTTPSATDPATAEALYNLDFTVGSGDITAMNADQSACIAAGEANSDLTYCTVQSFSIVLRTGNRFN
ncbi:MAG: prepilin-type N-terminal cleavage/methylation domain-containing protein [Candidatus Microsaccharimonas sp.]